LDGNRLNYRLIRASDSRVLYTTLHRR